MGEVDDKNKWPPFNPFVRHPTSGLGKLKMVLFGSILVPIRVIGTLLTLALVWSWCTLMSKGCDVSAPYSPLRRRVLVGGTRVAARVLLFFYGYLWIHVSYEIEDPKERADQPHPAIVISNHMGFAEILYLVAHDGCCFVSKEGNRALPFIGKVTEAIQSIFVERDQKKKTKSTTVSILERANAPPGTWPSLALYPEGTTTNGHALINFQTGAFRAGLPVQPVVLTMPFSPTHGYDPSFTCANIFQCILGLMTQPMNHMYVTHLAVYSPNEAEKADAKLFANNVRARMAQSLGVQTYPLSWVDKLPYEPSKKEKELGIAKLTERNGGVLPSPPVFTEDPFGNLMKNDVSKQD